MGCRWRHVPCWVQVLEKDHLLRLFQRERGYEKPALWDEVWPRPALRARQRHVERGHDEYMYHLAEEQTTLPPEGLAMIRYHSFYPWHSEGALRKYLMNEKDKEMLECVQAFNPYDLYSKTDVRYDIEELKPYYLELIQ